MYFPQNDKNLISFFSGRKEKKLKSVFHFHPVCEWGGQQSKMKNEIKTKLKKNMLEKLIRGGKRKKNLFQWIYVSGVRSYMYVHKHTWYILYIILNWFFLVHHIPTLMLFLFILDFHFSSEMRAHLFIPNGCDEMSMWCYDAIS